MLQSLRDMIEGAEKQNDKFRKAALRFLKHAQDTINPRVTAADVREMLIQHILTEEIFSQVFDNADFHRQNNVAKELYALENTFFTGKVKHETLAGLRPYYAAIRSAAALVTSHHEKQKFLKDIYENFYKVYDKKKADRLGVVYTPNEIVRFMVESADWLCQKHFGKSLIDKGVEILDPACGTGTFITELIEHFRGQPAKLRYKYMEELHANEVAILPYYVANLNIEATYAAINGYEEYPNLCFVDTLDNTAALRTHKGQQFDMFGAVSEENVARIKRQNKKKISVIIGNPPYNANQLNENENNKNREYLEIDQRIRDTYIDASDAQKTKLYDMYARFFRWASDRIDGNGIVAFITNRSFIDSRTFDGFRKIVAEDFNDIYVVDLGGDVRADPRLSGTKHNVFGIQTGVAISFMIKRTKDRLHRIHYTRRPQLDSAEEKLSFLANAKMTALPFEIVEPDTKQNWLDISTNDFDSFIPLCDRDTKQTNVAGQERAIFKLYSQGLKTNRDEWVYGFSRDSVAERVEYLVGSYERQRKRLGKSATPDNVADIVDYEIKWTRKLKNQLVSDKSIRFDPDKIVSAQYRPFVRNYSYFSWELNEDWYKLSEFVGTIRSDNKIITFLSIISTWPLATLAVDGLFDYCLLKQGNGATQSVARWLFHPDGARLDNMTDWGLSQFRAHYQSKSDEVRLLTKDDIFHYVYAVLHDPAYRKKYATNLKRELPRIPFYPNFWTWAGWGEALMKLHVGYEAVEPWALTRIDTSDEKSRKAGLAPKAVLRADKESGNIRLDSETQLTGVPPEAWTYKLGNRSALEWILDQYKEKTPKDPTIREKFNTYRFADHKEKVIGLLKRVTRVSVETMKIVEAMRQEKR